MSATGTAQEVLSDKVVYAVAGMSLGTWAGWHAYLKTVGTVATDAIPVLSALVLAVTLLGRFPAAYGFMKPISQFVGRHVWQIGAAVLAFVGVVALIAWLRSPAKGTPLAAKSAGESDADEEEPSGSKLYDLMFKYLGTKEALPSGKPNPVVKQMIAGVPSWTSPFNPCKVPWCAIGLNWFLMQVKLPGTNSGMARSFLHWGKEVDEPRRGDIVVLLPSKIDDGVSGHVGVVHAVTPTTVEVLGCNQGDSISIVTYSRKKVLGFRRHLPLWKSKQTVAGVVAGTAATVGGAFALAQEIEAIKEPLQTLAPFLPPKWGAYVTAACTVLTIVGAVVSVLERKQIRAKIGW